MGNSNGNNGNTEQRPTPPRPENYADTILRAGTALAGLKAVDVDGDESPVAIVPDGFKVESLAPLLLARPRRYGATIHLGDVDSFVRYVKEHTARFVDDDDVEATMYYTVEPARFTHIFNDHSGAGPDWRDYRAIYTCPPSPEWRTWFGNNGKQKTQADFARFIEDNLPDVVAPPAADMLELSRTLEARKAVNFASSTRLSNGATELQYTEEITGTSQKGKMQVPDEFTIGIPVFKNGPGYRIICRFRYRLEGPRLLLWYEMVRPHKILEDAIKQVREQIEEGTQVKPYLGTFNGDAIT